MTRPPDATSRQRITWAEVPDAVRASIERLLGDRVVEAVSQPGGFSEGLAARLRLAGGGRVFVKAASAATVVEFHRREIAVTGRLPAAAPVPRLLATHDDGAWVALVFEEIDGGLPAQPWRPDEFDLVLSAVTELTGIMTPTPIASLTTPPRLGGWAHVAVDRLATLSPWAVTHLDALLALEEHAPQVLAGRTLLHGDLYPFNLMLAGRRVFVIDWPHAWVGAAHCDLVTLLSSASLSGVDPQPFAERHPLTRDLDPLQLDVVLALHAGFLLHRATSAGPSADRNLVNMMTALGLASVRWLRQRGESGRFG
ncbi:aminoglycoside phosphotransferase family protein [Dactylosporangium sp. NPDC049525]|uniref:phosphotransferase family protein n=1 Tax=Dactylosporangium sp. NPDC049525 TaxID=3154730 RepID=UPI00342909EC